MRYRQIEASQQQRKMAEGEWRRAKEEEEEEEEEEDDDKPSPSPGMGRDEARVIFSGSSDNVGCGCSVVFRSVRRIDYRLYLTLCLRLLFPTLYSTFRVYILGSLPDAGPLSIASQMAWVSVLLEVVEEGLLLPLYHCLGSSLADTASTKNKVKTGLLVSAVVYLLFSLTVAALAWPLVHLMAQEESLQEETVDYIRLELVAIVSYSLDKLLKLVMVLHQWNSSLYLSLFVQMVSSITFDYLLVSEHVANLGVNGVAYSGICTSNIVLVVSFVIVWKRLGFSRRDVLHSDYNFGWFRQWTRVGSFSAVDSLVRNAVYIIFVLRAMNLLEEQDSYWIANTFIWSWMLLPALPLADVLKQDISDGRRDAAGHWEKTSGYAALSFLLFAAWAALYPAWRPFIESVLKAPDADLVMDLAELLMPCYVFFVLGNLMKSVFYALGRTELLVVSSLLGNVALIVLYVLFLCEVIPNTVLAVAAIFGFGLVFGFFITSALYARELRGRGFLL